MEEVRIIAFVKQENEGSVRRMWCGGGDWELTKDLVRFYSGDCGWVGIRFRLTFPRAKLSRTYRSASTFSRAPSFRLPMVVSGVVVVQCSMKSANTAVLVMSGRGFVREAPQVVQRHRVVPLLVVPLRFMVPPQWQRGRFFGIGIRHHLPYTTGWVQHRGFCGQWGGYMLVGHIFWVTFEVIGCFWVVSDTLLAVRTESWRIT